MNTTVSLNQREGVASATTSEWIDPRVSPAPIGLQISILTAAGRMIQGIWSKEMQTSGDYVAWAPLIRIPSWARERMAARYASAPSAPFEGQQWNSTEGASLVYVSGEWVDLKTVVLFNGEYIKAFDQ